MVCRRVAPEKREPGAGAVAGYSWPPLCLEFMKALKIAMPVSRIGNFCEASTLVWACSSMRLD